jgi:hypothetical protein
VQTWRTSPDPGLRPPGLGQQSQRALRRRLDSFIGAAVALECAGKQPLNQYIYSEVALKKLVIGVLLAVVLPSTVAAQNKDYLAQGYVFIGPTTFTERSRAALHLGAGAEALVYKGLGVGGEIGYLSDAQDLGQGMGVFSLNGSYNFQRSRRVSPFLTGGPTLALGSDVAGVVMNLGGGLHWWFKERIGLRFEVRDHFTPESGAAHIISIRIGLAFR